MVSVLGFEMAVAQHCWCGPQPDVYSPSKSRCRRSFQFFFLIFFLGAITRTLAVSETGRTYNGTDRQQRNTPILEIWAAYNSEQNAKLADAQCCADILSCFIPLLSTQVLASGTQRFTHEEQSSFQQLLQVRFCRSVLLCYQPEANTGCVI